MTYNLNQISPTGLQAELGRELSEIIAEVNQRLPDKFFGRVKDTQVDIVCLDSLDDSVQRDFASTLFGWVLSKGFQGNTVTVTNTKLKKISDTPIADRLTLESVKAQISQAD